MSDKIDLEVIALSEEVVQKVQTRHDMARARMAAERLRLKLIEDAERIAADMIEKRPEDEALITERLRGYKAIMANRYDA